MKIDLKEIQNLIHNGNLSDVSRETGIAYRTLQDWRLKNNKWLADAEERLTKLQNYINKENGTMRIMELEKEELNKLESILKEKWNTMDAWDAVKDDSIDNIGKYLEGTGYYLSGKDFTIKKENKYTVKNLMNTVYDEANGTIDLEFDINGEQEFATVEAPEESFTDEFYFDDQVNLNKALENEK